jgi:hypothetical protein
MSRAAKGRIIPKKGTIVPDDELQQAYAKLISNALREDLGGTHQAIKTAMKWTGAKERAVKNWFCARSGPSGAHLIGLMRHSDAICNAALLSAGRVELASAQKLLKAKTHLEFMLETLRALSE